MTRGCCREAAPQERRGDLVVHEKSFTVRDEIASSRRSSQ
jgi:hypothetical protein